MSLVVFGMAVFCIVACIGLPPGPAQLEIWRESLAGNRRRAVATLTGMATGDLCLGMATALGLNPWASTGRAAGLVFLINALILIGLGLNSVRQSLLSGLPVTPAFPAAGLGPGPHRFPPKANPRRNRSGAFFMGLTLILINPLGLATWALIHTGLNRLGAPSPVKWPEAGIFCLAVIAGTSVYPGLIIQFAPRLAHRLKPKKKSLLTGIFGFVIIAFGLYFLFRAVHSITEMRAV